MAALIYNPTNPMMKVTPSEQLIEWHQHINSILPRYLPAITEEPIHLHQAMHYTVCNGGKRLRPLLVYAAYHALASHPHPALDTLACAVEYVHAYSLVHDDLPAMDNDSLRRGIPTCHIAFDEATAILAGDALQSQSFHILASIDDTLVPAKTLTQCVQILAKAIGSQGMAGGQAIDLSAIGQQLDRASLEKMHAYKTGALINASIQMGALFASCSKEQWENLNEFGTLIGLAFQIQDDILDVEGNVQTVGKMTQKDQANAKPTFTSMLGIEQSKSLLQQTYAAAMQKLAHFNDSAIFLREIAQIIISRNN